MALHNNTTTPATSAGIKPLWGTLTLPKTGKSSHHNICYVVVVEFVNNWLVTSRAKA